MEEAKPSKELQSLYSKKDKEEAEEERSRALEAVSDTSEDEEENPDDFDYEVDKKNRDKQKKEEKEKESRFGKYDPKKQLVQHLEKKSEVFQYKKFKFITNSLISLKPERNRFTKRRASPSRERSRKQSKRNRE